MKISTKARYGLRALLELVRLGGENDYVPLSVISANQNISLNYLESSFAIFKKAKIVESNMGKFGGYKLSKPSDGITVKQVLDSVEGRQKIAPKGNSKDDKISLCIKKLVWDKIDSGLCTLFENTSLCDLSESHKGKSI